MSLQHNPWAFHHWHGAASDFHAMSLGFSRSLWWCSVDTPAVILGSTQSRTDVNEDLARQLGIAVVQRRSGGGIVYVHPNDSLWLDVTIPQGDRVWTDDVSTSMMWLGEVLVEALSPWLSTVEYRGVFDVGRDGRTVCFASTSPGEVFAGTSKVVGISQRRTRDGARFQCVMYTRWNPTEWTQLLSDLTVAERTSHLAVEPVNAPAESVVESVLAALARR